MEPAPALDSLALRRRVLLTAAVTFACLVLAAVALDAASGPPWLMLPCLVLIAVLVVRPLMKPVLAANRLRRALAYQAFLDSKSLDGQNLDGQGGDRG